MEGANITASPPGKQGKLTISSLSFIGVVLTSFFGALNDNMFRWLVVSVAVSLWGETNRPLVLTLGGLLFTLPFILFAAPAGFLADRFSKRNVLIWTKVLEVFAMTLGTVAIATGNVSFMMLIVFLMALHSTLFGPAKLGIIPELIREEDLPKASGVSNLATMLACIFGTIAGYGLYDIISKVEGVPGWLIYGPALIGVATVGWLCSLLVFRLEASQPERKYEWNWFSETFRNLKVIGNSEARWRVALGAAYFWSLGGLAQQTMNTYAKEMGVTLELYIGFMLVAMAIGVATGSLFAGWVSRRRVEVGTVAFSALALAACAMLLNLTSRSYSTSIVVLFFLGFSGGMYDVPLMSYLQRYSSDKERGSVFAALNFLTFNGLLLASGLFYGLSQILTPGQIFLVAGLITLGVAIYMVPLMTANIVRSALWLAHHIVYRVRVFGIENIPKEGGVLLVSNHVSWADGILIGIHCPRDVRMIAFDGNLNHWLVDWFTKLFNVIPINASSGPKALVTSLRAAGESLKKGEVVCIFAEGGISRLGHTLGFQRGVMKILEGTGAPVVPVYINEIWGSIFSFERGKFFKKWPYRLPYPLTIGFGPALKEPKQLSTIREAVLELGTVAMEQRKPRVMTLPRKFLRQCRKNSGVVKVADSSGQELKGRDLLLRSLIVARVLSRLVKSDEKYIGLLIPPSVGGALANVAVSLLKRTSINLNYTLSEGDLNQQLALAGVKHVLTSRKFMERVKLDLNTEYLYLEDFAGFVTSTDKILSALQARILPVWVLERIWGLTSVKPDDELTVIFTSGSTGEAKGVVLSHHNVATNVEAVQQLYNLTKEDALIGVLPFFHSFGYTATMWTVLSLDARGVYHYNPLDPRTIGKLAQDYGGTILMATPTFLRNYVKRCEKEQFAKMRVVITGAEKLPADLANSFQEKFGVQIMEGYGTTELSPLVSVNVPNISGEGWIQVGHKPGTVGRTIPGVAAKIVDPDTFVDQPSDVPGLLLIKGPNVMQGYLKRPEKTAEVIRDGWYNTGDIATIDGDGFIRITDRQSRFSKIGGEMVPHLKIEQEIAKILVEPTDEGPELRVVVTAIPDEKKGEKLIVIHKPTSKTPSEICTALGDSGLPNLWIPAVDGFVEIEEIPILGSGKLDLKKVKKLALERFTEPAPSSTT